MADNQTIAAWSGGPADTKSDSKQKGKLAGRWIAFLPAAALAAVTIQFVFGFVNRITVIFVGINPDELLMHGYTLALSGGMMGAAFVYVGARVAPNSRRMIALSLAGLTLFLIGMSTLASLLTHDHWALWQGVFCALGASATAWSIL